MDPTSVLLTDRVAVVTGGGAGIGRGIARGLAAFGARVAIWERDADTPRGRGRGGRRPRASPPTSASREQVDAALARTIDELGPVDILVNNAGGVFISPILETSENGWDALYRANLKHVILCTQRVARTMVDDGLRRKHHQRDVDRRSPGRARICGLRRGQGRSDQLHQDRRVGVGPQRDPGERPGPRHHADRGHDGRGPPGVRGALRPDDPDGTGRPRRRDGGSRRVPGRSDCRATSPDRPSTSTGAPTPRAAGTTTPRTVRTSSARPDPRTVGPDAADAGSDVVSPGLTRRGRRGRHGRTCRRRW